MFRLQVGRVKALRARILIEISYKCDCFREWQLEKVRMKSDQVCLVKFKEWYMYYSSSDTKSDCHCWWLLCRAIQQEYSISNLLEWKGKSWANMFWVLVGVWNTSQVDVYLYTSECCCQHIGADCSWDWMKWRKATGTSLFKALEGVNFHVHVWIGRWLLGELEALQAVVLFGPRPWWFDIVDVGTLLWKEWMQTMETQGYSWEQVTSSK